MFTALLGGVFELLLFIGAVVVCYQIFVSDWWSAKRMKTRESRAKFDSIEKIAQVKLVSDDKKDIEKFVTDNAMYLTNQMVQKLVARIESLKIDDVIRDDEILKKRIADLPQDGERDVKAEAETFAEAMVARHK